MSPALQGRADMAEPAQILQWRSPMKLNMLNFVPMGRSMLRPYENPAPNKAVLQTATFSECSPYKVAMDKLTECPIVRLI